MTAASEQRRRLSLVLAITVAILAVEIFDGVAARSLALTADAGHMATDTPMPDRPGECLAAHFDVENCTVQL